MNSVVLIAMSAGFVLVGVTVAFEWYQYWLFLDYMCCEHFVDLVDIGVGCQLDLSKLCFGNEYSEYQGLDPYWNVFFIVNYEIILIWFELLVQVVTQLYTLVGIQLRNSVDYLQYTQAGFEFEFFVTLIQVVHFAIP